MARQTPFGKMTAKQYAKRLYTDSYSEDAIRMSLLAIFGNDSAYDDVVAKKAKNI